MSFIGLYLEGLYQEGEEEDLDWEESEEGGVFDFEEEDCCASEEEDWAANPWTLIKHTAAKQASLGVASI
jgi:hypothetical protein